MSGKPNKTENDIIRHKNEYIERLNLEAEINKKNYDANKLYKETGQVMPIIGLNDNRSIEDKLLDIEKLKQDIAKTIGTISSLTFGTSVVASIQESPLNIDNKLLVFTAQRINEIILNLKKIYAIGIKGDKNDVQQLVNFITKMYSDANAFTQTAKNFVNTQPSGALTPAGNPNIGAMQNVKTTLTSLLPPFGQFLEMFKIYYQQLPPNITNANLERTIMTRYEEAFQIINYLIAVCITPQQYNHILNIAKEYNFGGNVIDIARIIIQSLSEVFPQPNVVLTFFQKNLNAFEIAKNFENLRNDYNRTGVNGPFFESYRNAYLTSLDKLNEVLLKFLGLLNPAGFTLQQYDEQYIFLQDFFRTYGDGGNDGGGPPPPPNVQAGNLIPPPNVQAGNLIPPRNPPPAPPQAPRLVPQAPPVQNIVIQHPPSGSSSFSSSSSSSSSSMADLVRGIPALATGQSPQIMGQFIRAMQEWIDNGRIGAQPQYPMSGNGIKRRRGRPKGTGVLKPYSQTVSENLDLTRGIEPTGKFIKFGKYLLNSHKLNKENIFSLKHISGGNIIDIPSTRLTEGLGKVIKTIIGGGNPNYNDLNGLSENEQNYLHKVCSKSNIVDKLSIPTPSKDAEEKEIHKFEVMKGEIASGNDSPELIKNFKRMLMKLQKNNSLPKKEVYEILEELNTLGY
jgi:hypothetical protein